MFSFTSLITGPGTWITAGSFLATITFFGWTDNGVPSIGVIEERYEEQADPQRLFSMQLTEALYFEDDMAAKYQDWFDHATDPEVKEMLEAQRKEAALDVDRIKKLFEINALEEVNTTDRVSNGLIAEADALISSFKNTELLDHVIIACANKVAHHEVSCYQNLMRTAELSQITGETSELLEESMRQAVAYEQLLKNLAAKLIGSARERGQLDR